MVIQVSLSQLGVTFLECQHHKQALVAFKGALKIRRRCLGPYHSKVAKSLNNIGCTHFELGEVDAARAAFREALSVQRTLNKETPSEKIVLSIAATQCNLSSVALTENKFDEAARSLEAALLVRIAQSFRVMGIL